MNFRDALVYMPVVGSAAAIFGLLILLSVAMWQRFVIKEAPPTHDGVTLHLGAGINVRQVITLDRDGFVVGKLSFPGEIGPIRIWTRKRVCDETEVSCRWVDIEPPESGAEF